MTKIFNNMRTLLCLNLLCFAQANRSICVHVMYLPISFRVATLPLGQSQSYDCRNVSEMTMCDAGTLSDTTEQRYNTVQNESIIHRMYLQLWVGSIRAFCIWILVSNMNELDFTTIILSCCKLCQVGSLRLCVGMRVSSQGDHQK